MPHGGPEVPLSAGLAVAGDEITVRAGVPADAERDQFGAGSPKKARSRSMSPVTAVPSPETKTLPGRRSKWTSRGRSTRAGADAPEAAGSRTSSGDTPSGECHRAASSGIASTIAPKAAGRSAADSPAPGAG